jgi:lipopolysaccharide export system protein LptA
MYPADGSKVEAENLTLFPKEKRFEARGKVRTEASEKRIVTADSLDFRESGEKQQTAHYVGNVFVSGPFGPPKNEGKSGRKVDLELRTRDLVVDSRNGDLDTIVASGAVDLTQRGRKGRGERLVYNGTTGDILLIGTSASEAEISDPDRTWKACTIQIAADGSKTAMPCSDRGATFTSPIKTRN